MASQEYNKHVDPIRNNTCSFYVVLLSLRAALPEKLFTMGSGFGSTRAVLLDWRNNEPKS